MKRNWFIAISFLLVSLFISSCEIGLGASVDVQAPTIGISYPEISSVIRGSFVFRGTCSDDIGVEQVEVNVYRVDGEDNRVNVGTYQAQVSEDGKSWSVELNEFDPENSEYINGWKYKDGTYQVSAVAIDKAKRKS